MERQSKQKITFLEAALERPVVVRALKVSAVVGTILVAINHGDIILNGSEIIWWKIGLTYLVPYSVATYAAARQAISK